MKVYMDSIINKINFGKWQDFIDKIQDKAIDLIIADPMYNCTACSWDEETDLPELFESCNRIIKDNKAILVHGSQPFTSDLIQANRAYYKYCWYWKKNKGSNFLHAKKQPLRMIEEVCVFSKGSLVYNPQMTSGHAPTSSAKGRNTGNVYHGKMKLAYKGGKTTRYPKNVLDIKGVSNYARIHPTEKPLELICYFLNTYTKPGDIVVDLYSGSGVAAHACEELGRKYICFEKGRKEYKDSLDRLKSVKAQGKLFPEVCC